MSLRSSERGLKYTFDNVVTAGVKSLRSSERGLKSEVSSPLEVGYPSLRSSERGLKYLIKILASVKGVVAPFVGAWIEMLAKLSRSPSMSSLRSSERGLKFYLNYYGKKN